LGCVLIFVFELQCLGADEKASTEIAKIGIEMLLGTAALKGRDEDNGNHHCQQDVNQTSRRDTEKHSKRP